MDERPEILRRRIAELGFDDVRFARAADPPAAGLRAWLAAGHHADMQWMERTSAKRENPDLVLPGARSALMLGVSYWPGRTQAPARGPAWARYALYSDYHDTIRPGLERAGKALEEIYGLSLSDYRYYVDTGPVLERGLAARAGVGFIGKNAMLISRRHGNWLFLAAILTRAEIAPDPPISKKEGKRAGSEGVGLLCGKCTRCLDACPTRAFPSPGVVDSRLCISYQTIENRGVIPRELRAGIGGRVYGCDVCLEVCPWNRFAREGSRLLLAARSDLATLSLRELLELTPERFSSLFRQTAIKRLKWTGLVRNACVAAGNSGDSDLLEPLALLARGGPPVIRIHAVWAVRRLAGPRAEEWLREAREAETDAEVLAEHAAT